MSDSPLAYWRLDEPVGPVAHDQTSNHNDALFTGTVVFGANGALASNSNAAVMLDGRSGYIRADGDGRGPAGRGRMEPRGRRLRRRLHDDLSQRCSYPGTTTTQPIPVVKNDFLIGAGGSAPEDFCSCAIDEVAVYDHPLTALRVAAHYKAAGSHWNRRPAWLVVTRRLSPSKECRAVTFCHRQRRLGQARPRS